jgi:serine/threonine-protein kinase HipA
MADSGAWTASPAYDLTFSRGASGEHALTISGEGARPGEAHIKAAGKTAGVSDEIVSARIERVRTAINRWPEFAGIAGVTQKTTAAIDRLLNGVRAKPRKGGKTSK